ncbi:MAG: hypothetical protein DCF29_22280 [Alphaproteobacteria bacterium]|nr:MAG: hypothetical protein DCF29_22280 [Alphaproteobacteria bacterium]
MRLADRTLCRCEAATPPDLSRLRPRFNPGGHPCVFVFPPLPPPLPPCRWAWPPAPRPSRTRSRPTPTKRPPKRARPWNRPAMPWVKKPRKSGRPSRPVPARSRRMSIRLRMIWHAMPKPSGPKRPAKNALNS